MAVRAGRMKSPKTTPGALVPGTPVEGRGVGRVLRVGPPLPDAPPRHDDEPPLVEGAYVLSIDLRWQRLQVVKANATLLVLDEQVRGLGWGVDAAAVVDCLS